MKKIVLATAALIAAAGLAQAASIVGSKHDIPSLGTLGGTMPNGEICAYCHTPHNPIANTPLWNRVNPSNTGWSFYQSPTLTSAATGASFESDSISIFCLSCHDGSTSLGAIKNVPVTTIGADGAGPLSGASAISAVYANIGNSTKNLSNDHPVGFDYSVAQTQDAGSNTGGLRQIADVKTAFSITDPNYNPFYNAAGGRVNQMECASCHKVHDPGASWNFLRIENTGSALCLACHNK